MDVATLLRHNAWANRLWATRLQELGWPERPAKLLSHCVLGETLWLGRITGEGAAIGDVFRLLPHDEVAARLDRLLPVELEWLASEPDRMQPYVRLNGDTGSATVAEILAFVCTHGVHHRAQIASWAAAEKVPYPSTDLLGFLRLTRT